MRKLMLTSAFFLIYLGVSAQTVNNDGKGTVITKYKSSNGDRNTIIQDHNTNRTTTIIRHPNGTKEINGLKQDPKALGRSPGSTTAAKKAY